MKKFIYVSVLLTIIIGVGIIILSKKPVTTTQSDQTLITSADNAPSGSLHNLPVPTPVAVARKAASQVLGVPEGEAIVMSAFEKEWSDSCLGLGELNESCLQVITEGYEVTVQGNGKDVIYRTNQDGSVIRQQK